MNHRNSSTKDFLPLLFLIEPTFFRFNSYDLVFLIPFFTWSRAVGKTEQIAFLVPALCFALVIPSKGLHMAYRKGLDNFVSPEVYQLIVATFRSWILVLLYLRQYICRRRRCLNHLAM